MIESAKITKTLEILKQAIILEKRGLAFYQKIGELAQDKAVRSFFDVMAQEEVNHLKVLSVQFKAYKNTGCFQANSFDKIKKSQLPSAILNKEIRDKISAAGFEASAISAAIAMEQRAIDVYSNQAKDTQDPEEKKVYTWLAGWERDHLNMLMEIDRKLLDRVWQDNNFWPF